MHRVKGTFTVKSHFEGKNPVVGTIYARLLKTMKQIGPFIEAPGKTGIQLINKNVLADVSPRRDHLILTLNSDHKLSSPRIHKAKRVSTKKFRSRVKFQTPEDIDAEVADWLKQSYARFANVDTLSIMQNQKSAPSAFN